MEREALKKLFDRFGLVRKAYLTLLYVYVQGDNILKNNPINVKGIYHQKGL